MNRVKQFMNKITDKTVQGSPDPSSGVTQQKSIDDGEGELAAEGFLCPQCMTAFASGESLQSHYETSHELAGTSSETQSMDSNLAKELDSTVEQELFDLRCSLEEERIHSAEMHREVQSLKTELERKNSMTSAKSQDTFAERDDGSTGHEAKKVEDPLPSLIEQIKLLNRTIREKDLEISDLKTERTQLERVLSEEKMNRSITDKRHIEMKNEISKLNEENNEILTTCDDTKRELDKLGITLNAVTTTMEELNLGEMNLKSEIQRYEHTILALKSELAKVMDDKSSLELKSNALDLDLKTLRHDYTDLISRIEGDEAAHAAITSLTKERDTLKDNFESLQNQKVEVSKNLHNISLEVDKFKEVKAKMESEAILRNEQILEQGLTIDNLNDRIIEQKLLAEVTQKELVKSKDTLLKKEVQLQEKEKELTKHHELEAVKLKGILELTEQVKLVDEELTEAQERLTNLKYDLELSRSTEVVNAKKLVDVEEAYNKTIICLNDLEKEKDSALKKVEHCLEQVKKQGDLHETYIAASITNENKLNTEIRSLEGKLAHEKELTSRLEMKRLEELAGIQILMKLTKGGIDHMEVSINTVAKEFSHKINSIEKCLTRCESELNLKSKTIKEKDTKHQENLNEIASVYKKLKQRENDQDELLLTMNDLKKNCKSTEEARALLLTRFIQCEGELENLREENRDLHRQLDDSLAALNDLGRENQSLQVENAKVQSRKWTDDSVVVGCCTCSREFSITLRKHHCRVCGNIFCNDCSAKTASIPSSKKPVRVCDSCYIEIMNK